MIKWFAIKIINSIKNFIKYIHYGGVVYVKISQINHGEILKEKKILITGGSSGIGYAIAKKFLNEGAKVVITGRDPKKLLMATEALNSNRLSYLQWDCSDSSISKSKLAEAQVLLGGIDIVINNAGLYTTTSFSGINEEIWDKVMDTNLKGLFFMCQAEAEYFMNVNKECGGKILNISSIRGFQGDCGPYGVSKWGVNGLTKGLARDLISKNILVNAIAPGITATDINGIDVNKNAFSGEPRNKRVALPEEIAELALFLASDASNNIVGQIIVCDGGSTLI
jgi:NAD(P)-dependent dehydrogenase (short-subunit alcohol dehydrogenase family)